MTGNGATKTLNDSPAELRAIAKIFDRPDDHHDALISQGLAEDIRAALEGDSNDAEHDALSAVASSLGISWTPYDDLMGDDD